MKLQLACDCRTCGRSTDKNWTFFSSLRPQNNTWQTHRVKESRCLPFKVIWFFYPENSSHIYNNIYTELQYCS